jgi:hypothetical protein
VSNSLNKQTQSGLCELLFVHSNIRGAKSERDYKMTQTKVFSQNDYYSVSECGEVTNNQTGRVLKHQVNNKGYHMCELKRDKRRQYFLVHRLVAMTFIPNPNNLPQVEHKDRDHTNNHVSNLRWSSQTDNLGNMRKRTQHGSRPCSSRYKGVSWNKNRQLWRAYICYEGKQRDLGYFNTEKEAGEAYNAAAYGVFGVFKYLNVIN